MKINWIMLLKKQSLFILGIKKQKNTEDLLTVTVSDTYSHHWASKGDNRSVQQAWQRQETQTQFYMKTRRKRTAWRPKHKW
jgi:hypothetical protein